MLSFLLLVETVTLVAAISLLLNYVRSPLRSIPGPLVAKFSNVWRLWDVWKGHADITQRRLHRLYGDVVRVGPNCVSLSDSSLIHKIYGTRNPFKKSEFYLAGATIANGKRIEGIFNTRNEEWHEYQVRPIKSAFSLTNVLKLEPLIDKALDYFVHKLRSGYATSSDLSRSCPIGVLLRHFAWDVIGEATFSERFGILDGNTQMLQLLEAGDRASDYLGVIGQMPLLESLVNNPRYPLIRGGHPHAAMFSAKRLAARMDGSDGHDTLQQPDLLQLFINAETDEEDKSQLTRRQIGWTIMVMVAGSDTTATTLRSAVYFIARNEKVKYRLVAELRKEFTGKRPDWITCQKLPYLDAVIKETLRLEPAVGLMLERIVPAGGLRLSDGRILPEDTVVGVNPRVINHDERIFGQDTGEFVPERWLRDEHESKADFESRLARMKKADFTFGIGKRGCLGRNLALLEVYKCVSRLFLEFNISPSDPQKEWTKRTGFFLKQSGIDVHLREQSN